MELRLEEAVRIEEGCPETVHPIVLRAEGLVRLTKPEVPVDRFLREHVHVVHTPLVEGEEPRRRSGVRHVPRDVEHVHRELRGEVIVCRREVLRDPALDEIPDVIETHGFVGQPLEVLVDHE